MKWLQEPSEGNASECMIVICCSNSCFLHYEPCTTYECRLHY
jgi:hypothetical protein